LIDHFIFPVPKTAILTSENADPVQIALNSLQICLGMTPLESSTDRICLMTDESAGDGHKRFNAEVTYDFRFCHYHMFSLFQ
jgi:hypothetical protein